MSGRPCVAGKEFHDEWIEDLCLLISEDDILTYSNPDGAAEAIILDVFTAYARERQARPEHVIKAEALREAAAEAPKYYDDDAPGWVVADLGRWLRDRADAASATVLSRGGHGSQEVGQTTP